MTSAIEAFDVLCPQCGYLYQDWYRPLVNLEYDDFDNEHLEECGSAVCPNCQFTIYFDSLIFKDGMFKQREQV
jgi:hypothetical protein